MGIARPNQKTQLLIEGINVVFIAGKPVFTRTFAQKNSALVMDQSILWFDVKSQQVFKANPAGTFCPLESIVAPNTILTFNAANQNIANGALVPPENKLRAYNDNAVRTRILNNHGNMVTSVGSQHAFFASSEDLLVVGNGSTWGMSWEMDFTTADAGTSWQIPYILDTDITTPAATGFRSEAILIMNLQIDGKSVFFFRKEAGTGIFKVFLNGTGAYSTEGTKIKCSIARAATTFDFVFDIDGVFGKLTASINIVDVFTHTKNLFGIGDFTNSDFTGTLNIKNWAYPNAN